MDRRAGEPAIARYAVLLVPDLESGGSTVTVPALPGCITHGETIDESLAQVEEAIGLYLHGEDEANLAPRHGRTEVIVASVEVTPAS